jgi:hypothetical protein
MRIVHIGDDNNIEIYKKLLNLYQNEDFDTIRNAKEKRIELEIIIELSEMVHVAQLIKNEPEKYLDIIKSSKEKNYGDYTHFLRVVKADIKGYM